jgi:hypothetical protein
VAQPFLDLGNIGLVRERVRGADAGFPMPCFRIQSTTGFQLGWQHKVGDSLNIEPLVPFSLNADWDLIARPSLTITYAPTPHEQSGLEDLQTSFFLTPAKETTLISPRGQEHGQGRHSSGL